MREVPNDDTNKQLAEYVLKVYHIYIRLCVQSSHVLTCYYDQCPMCVLVCLCVLVCVCLCVLMCVCLCMQVFDTDDDTVRQQWRKASTQEVS